MKFAVKLNILLTVIVSIIAVVILAYTYFTSAYNLKQAIVSTMEQESTYILNQIDRSLYEMYSDIQTIANDPIFLKKDVKPKEITKQLIHYRNIYKKYVSIAFYNENRIKIADSSGIRIGKKELSNEFWKNNHTQNKICYDVYVSKDLKMPVFYFALTLENQKNKPFGTLVANIPFIKLYEKMNLLYKSQYKEIIDVHLIDHNGLILYSNKNIKACFKQTFDSFSYLKTQLGEKTQISGINDQYEKSDHFFVFTKEQGYLDFKGSSWYLNIYANKHVVFHFAYELRKQLFLIFIVIFACILIVTYFFSHTLSKPIVTLSQWAKKVADGELIDYDMIPSNDEIGELSYSFKQVITYLNHIVDQAQEITLGNYTNSLSLRSENDLLGITINKMLESFKNIVDYANAISNGDYSLTIIPRSDKDELSLALNHMMKTLQDASEKSLAQDWLKTGQTNLSNEMSGNKDITKLSMDIISCISQYLNCQVGLLYIMNERNVLELKGTYAYPNSEQLKKTIPMGQGLIGQAAHDKKSLFLSDISEEFISIESSMLNAPAIHISIIPVVYQDEVKGVMELGAIKPVHDIHHQFLSLVSESIAIAIHSSNERQKIESLFQQTKLQAEELQAQQEELRVTNEELQEYTSALKQNEDRLKLQQEELYTINSELEEKNKYLEEQKYQITQKKIELENTHKNLEQKTQELKLASKYKSEFLANMSHELRTPLNSLLLLSKSLLDNKEQNLTETQRESAKIIHIVGNELLTLINEILDLSKIEAGKMPIHIEYFSLSDIEQMIQTKFKKLIDEKGLTLNVVLHKLNVSEIQTDPTRLLQIITNMISNALKFTHQGGITVEIFHPPDDTDLFNSGLDPNQSVAISFTDTGIGIPKNKQMLIFEAFQQADGSTSRKYGGTGLGLSICREIAKMLGGEIHLKSDEGKGSTFTLFLPIENKSLKEQTAIKPQQLSSQTIHVHRPRMIPSKPIEEIKTDHVNHTVINDDSKPVDKTILIVEDDPNFAKILSDQCHAKGFKCIATESAEQGLKLAETYQPKAIILDLNLPGMNGLMFMDIIKDNPLLRHIPVHIMSAEEKSIDALQKGAISYIEKPLSHDELEATFRDIEQFIAQKIKHLLIINHDSTKRMKIKTLIEGQDLNIVDAENAQAALKLIRTNSFDCIILDDSLPDMSSFELLKKLEQEKSLKIPPVIIYSGENVPPDQSQAFQDYSKSIIVKRVKSEEQLLDETAIFLHRVVKELPEEKQKIIFNKHDKDYLFQDKKVLLVDDDMRNLFALSNMLKEKGMEIIKAPNGVFALRVLEQEKNIDLILMDMMMPEMDGYTACTKIREQQKYKNLPIIALTAKAMIHDRNKCIEAGASDYLSKPIDIERLFSMMRIWLSK